MCRGATCGQRKTDRAGENLTLIVFLLINYRCRRDYRQSVVLKVTQLVTLAIDSRAGRSAGSLFVQICLFRAAVYTHG